MARARFELETVICLHLDSYRAGSGAPSAIDIRTLGPLEPQRLFTAITRCEYRIEQHGAYVYIYIYPAFFVLHVFIHHPSAPAYVGPPLVSDLAGRWELEALLSILRKASPAPRSKWAGIEMRRLYYYV